MKKKFKDTKVGKFILSKLPNFVSKTLPDSGVLGVVKNLIDADENLTAEEKQQYHREIVEIYELEVADRDSARRREVDVAKYGKTDYMFVITGLVGLLVFCFLVYSIVFLEIPERNKEVFIHLVGIAEGIVLSIFGYFFGGIVRKSDK